MLTKPAIMVVAVQVGFEEEPLLVQAVAHPEVGLFARGQVLGQEQPVLGPLQVEGAFEGGHGRPGKKGQGPVDFFGDFSPVLELEDGFGRRPRLHPGDHGGEDARAPAQEVLPHQGVGEGAFAGFHRTHHRQPEAVLGQVGPDLAYHLEPVPGLGRGPRKELLPFPGQCLEAVQVADKGRKGVIFWHDDLPEVVGLG